MTFLRWKHFIHRCQSPALTRRHASRTVIPRYTNMTETVPYMSAADLAARLLGPDADQVAVVDVRDDGKSQASRSPLPTPR